MRTGRTLDVLYEEAYSRASGNVQWSFTLLVRGPGGKSLLAVGGGHARRIAIATRTLTNVPFSGGDPNLMAW